MFIADTGFHVYTVQESALILLQTVPTHIQLDDIQRKLISQVDGVLAVHEFHVWQLAGDRIIASAHIRLDQFEQSSINIRNNDDYIVNCALQMPKSIRLYENC